MPFSYEFVELENAHYTILSNESLARVLCRNANQIYSESQGKRCRKRIIVVYRFLLSCILSEFSTLHSRNIIGIVGNCSRYNELMRNDM